MAVSDIVPDREYTLTELATLTGMRSRRLQWIASEGKLPKAGMAPHVRNGHIAKKRLIAVYRGSDVIDYIKAHKHYNGTRCKFLVALPYWTPVTDGIAAQIEQELIAAKEARWGRNPRPFFRKQGNAGNPHNYVSVQMTAELRTWLRRFGSMSAAAVAILTDRGFIAGAPEGAEEK
jgi:hypothetical protein